jgi:uncharacterized protein (DUF2147 family)
MRVLCCCILLLTSATAFAATPAGALGYWITPDKSIVHIAPCGAATGTSAAPVCLTVIQVPPNAPRGKDGQVTDGQNPDAGLRLRALCGLIIGNGFHQTDPNHLTGGKLYDPNTGHTYSGTIASDSDTLHLHGFIGISIFGRTETWHRTSAVPPCR